MMAVLKIQVHYPKLDLASFTRVGQLWQLSELVDAPETKVA